MNSSRLTETQAEPCGASALPFIELAGHAARAGGFPVPPQPIYLQQRIGGIMLFTPLQYIPTDCGLKSRCLTIREGRS